jgi:hypothetical protein
MRAMSFRDSNRDTDPREAQPVPHRIYNFPYASTTKSDKAKLTILEEVIRRFSQNNSYYRQFFRDPAVSNLNSEEKAIISIACNTALFDVLVSGIGFMDYNAADQEWGDTRSYSRGYDRIQHLKRTGLLTENAFDRNAPSQWRDAVESGIIRGTGGADSSWVPTAECIDALGLAWGAKDRKDIGQFLLGLEKAWQGESSGGLHETSLPRL